jgi:hypothetical protein
MGSIQTASLSVAMAALLAAHCAQAASSGVGQSDLDEVLVRAQRVQLPEMRKEMVELEDRFYARYDELNRQDDFDIHCFREARTGTRMIKRTCRAAYEEDAVQTEGREEVEYRQYLQDAQRHGYLLVPGTMPEPAMMAILARLDEFRANMRSVVNRDPQLLELLRERAELAKRYEAVRRRIFKRHPSQRDAAPEDTD